jgi:pimeloyl-ACP methyl ester carboxylesterase
VNLLRAAVLGLVAAACTPRVEPDYNRLPVLMVHGLGDTGTGTFGDLTRQLVALGWPREYLSAPDLLPPDGANILAAEGQLREAADSLLARRSAHGGGPARLIVVGHSMGALSARWYTTQVAPDRVAALLTLAGANHGTNAFCDRNAPGPDDMCPAFAGSVEESEIQVDLNGTTADPRDETPFGTDSDPPGSPTVPPDSARRLRYVALSAETERWIAPVRSTTLAGAENLRLSGTDHDAIAHDPRVATLLDEVERQAR